MTTITTQIDANKVLDLLDKASWSYEHCGDRIKSGDMDEYINEIEDNLSLPLVQSSLDSYKSEIAETFDGEGDINRWAAVYIADSVAWQISDCVYPTVTFIANL